MTGVARKARAALSPRFARKLDDDGAAIACRRLMCDTVHIRSSSFAGARIVVRPRLFLCRGAGQIG